MGCARERISFIARLECSRSRSDCHRLGYSSNDHRCRLDGTDRGNDHTVSRELMVLAIGSGSLILSHVNDAGFWLVKEYFGLSVVETFKSWTVMETILSVLGLVLVLLLSLAIH
jgi:H+/gluconate symporter and related permeases